MVMEKGDTDLSKLIRNTKHMSIHMIMYYWSEMLFIVNEIHAKGVFLLDTYILVKSNVGIKYF
jgi:hypothetical protein